ncbi:hypothetical protein GCK72_004465 [Caenorhabditis remanei]|uniref:Uncharacterized protein n=1 Tax=Caenorhabditis remanei TaxID=31234 RepID=A0A6A5HBH0_CAERE|nr:hypothetical protein GCK72_004465 [Caenorhabditis remanei]KAF1764517.1 hypothetical protein GCK72_004465 [Caenorhabditis remanei]
MSLVLNQESTEPLGMSIFAQTILKIAMEEGDFISEQTMKELEEMVQPALLPGKYSAASPGRVEITQEQLESVKTVCDVVKGLVDAGSFISEKLGKYLGPIGTVAGVVKDIIDFFKEEEEDPVMKELGELKKQLTALSQKMTAQFDDLKSFIVEQNFYDRYTTVMSTLFMYMLDTMNERSKKSVTLFAEVYNESKPQKLVYEMLSKLEQESTNPLKWAMKGDNLQSKATFKKWKGILEGVLTEALFLEVYASGLLPDVDSYGVNKILEKIARYQELCKEWDAYYLTTPNYWPAGVEKLVNDVQENKSLDSKDDKVDAVWKGIESIHTNSKFFAICLPNAHIWRYYKQFDSQAIVSDREGFVIIVYRSTGKPVRDREWLKNYMSTEMKLTREVEGWQWNHWSIVRTHLQQNKVDKNGKFFGTFYLVVAQKKDFIAVRYSDIDGWEYGPGFFTFDSQLLAHDGLTRSFFPMFYLLGD